MNIMYAKIFQKIHDSSIAEDYLLRLVFMDLLILSNRDGIVDMTRESIARRTNVPLEIVNNQIQKLESPDARSRSETDDGRRIERLDDHRDWGWRIVNFERYRQMKSSEEMREATRERVRRHREKQSPVGVAVASSNVKGASIKPTAPTNLEDMKAYAAQIGLPSEQVVQCFDYYESNGWKVGRNPMKSWQGAMRNWKRNYESRKYDNQTHSGYSTGKRRTDCNQGTLNEGKSHIFAGVGKVGRV